MDLQFKCKYLICFIAALVTVSCKVSTYLPHGNAVGIGLSIPMTITLRPDMCINCPMTLDVVPPYFANALTSQPMLEFKDCSLQYVGSNIIGSSLSVGDNVKSSARISESDGVLSLDFGTVDIPAGSTDIEVILSVDIRVKNLNSIQDLSVLSLQIKEQLDNQFNFVKESLQVVEPALPQIVTFEPHNPGVSYQSKDEPSIIFSVKLPVTSSTPVYNISITCSVTDASPNFRSATTNPDSVSIVVVEKDELQLIQFLADELKPGHVIVGKFGVYLQNSLSPDRLNMEMAVMSYSAPIENDGRKLETVTSNLIVPLKLKFPTLDSIFVPETTTVGQDFSVTVLINLPLLRINYKLVVSADFGGSPAVKFIAAKGENDIINGNAEITDNAVKIQGEGSLEEESDIEFVITGRVKPSVQKHDIVTLVADLSYISDGATIESESIRRGVVVKHPLLELDITAGEVDYVTLGESVSYTIVVSHSSSVDAYSLLLTVELSVPGLLGCLEPDLEVTQLTGKKIQISVDHLGVGEELKVPLSATPTSDDMLQNHMKILASYSYRSCSAQFCQTYTPAATESRGLRIQSTDIGTEFVPPLVAVKHPFILKILPVRDVKVCHFSGTLTLPSNLLKFQDIVVDPKVLEKTVVEDIINGRLKINVNSGLGTKINDVQIKFSSEVEDLGGIFKFGLISSYQLCESNIFMEETSSSSLEISEVDLDITITTTSPTIQSKSPFTYRVNFVFRKNIPIYNVTINVKNSFVSFGDDVVVKSEPDGFSLVMSYLESDKELVIEGVAEEMNLYTDTSASWSYEYNSAPDSGERYADSFDLPNVSIKQPSFDSFIENKAQEKITIGEEFVFGIEILTVEMMMDLKLRLEIPKCDNQMLFEVVAVQNPVVGSDVYLQAAPAHQIKDGVVEIWLEIGNRANSQEDGGDLLNQKINLRSLFSMLNCQDTTFPIRYTVDFGIDGRFERFSDTKYLTLAEPKLETEFSLIPSLELSHDAKDILLFDLKLWHSAQSSAPAYNIKVEMVCEEVNVLSFSVITPPPLNLQQGAVSLSFDLLSVGETFAAIVRTELKQEVTVSRAIACGGKVDFMSSDNEPSLNYIYTSKFIHDEIQLGEPSVSLWLISEETITYTYSIELAVPEGTLSSLIVTLNAGMGITITECMIQHLSLTSVSKTQPVQIQGSSAQIDFGAVYNKPDNLKTDADVVVISMVLTKNLFFADFDTVYVTLDGQKRTHAVPWNNECNLQLNLVRRDTAKFVEGGDEVVYEAIISHSTRSLVNCVEGRMFLPLENCEVRMEDQIEIRSRGGIRKMVDIEKSADRAIFKMDIIELRDEYTIPITIHISDTIYPGTQIHIQSYIMYKSDRPDALQQKSETCYTEKLLSAVPETTAKLITQHNSDVVSIGETVLIECLIVLPKGMMDLSVNAIGDDIDSVLMTEITSNLTTPSYENIQRTSGLNHGLVSYTQLYNSPENPSSAVLFTVSPRIYDSAANVNGKKLSLALVIAYSLTSRSMIEDALLFSLNVVEPVILVTCTIESSLESDNGAVITLTYSHSSPPHLKTSSANAYEITSILSPKFECSSEVTLHGIKVFNNTVYVNVLELSEELTLELSCLPSFQVELGKECEITIETEYSSNSKSGRKSRSVLETGAIFKSLEPSFNLKVQGIDGNNEIKLDEVIEAEFTISIPVGIFPSSTMLWRSSASLDFDINSCTFKGEDILLKTSRNSLGVESELDLITNPVESRDIVCLGLIKTVGGPDTRAGSITIAVNYGVNTKIVVRDIAINVPRLGVKFEMSGVGEVAGNEEMDMSFNISHLVDSTGDAFNVWQNLTVIGALIEEEDSLNGLIEQIVFGDSSTSSVKLVVKADMLPRTPVVVTADFSYTTTPDSTTTYSLPQLSSPGIVTKNVLFEVSNCQDKDTVPVGGYGFVCIEAVLPVCRTQFDISVKHPMLDDRELAEVVDGTQVTSSNPSTTTFTQNSVRHLITRSDLSISDISNSATTPDTLYIKLSILVFADEDVHDTDVIKFTFTIRHHTFQGSDETNAEVEFSVTEPHLSVQLTLSHDSDKTFEKDDVIKIHYTIRHTPASVTPAYNVRLLSNTTIFGDVSDDILAETLETGEVASGVVELVLQELPVFGAELAVSTILEFSSTVNDVGRVYSQESTAGVITVSLIKATLEVSQDSIPVGQIFPVTLTLDIPKAVGNVNVTFECTEFCVMIGSVALGEEDPAVLIQDTTLQITETQGDRQIEATLEFYLTEEIQDSSAEVSVKVGDIVASSTKIYPSDITLEIIDDSTDRPTVDAGNSVTKNFSMEFSETAYNTATFLTCQYTSSQDMQCTAQSCLISVVVSNNIPPGSDVTCDVVVTYSSHPFLGREYSSREEFLIGAAPEVDFSISPHKDYIAVGNEVESVLKLTISEVTTSVKVEVLCDDENNNFVISSLEVFKFLRQSNMERRNEDVRPGCGSITLDFDVESPSEDVDSQRVSLKVIVVLVDVTTNPAIINYKVTVGGESAYEHNQEINTCSPEFIVTPFLTSPTPYFTSSDSISYKTTIRNTGRCSFYPRSFLYDNGVDVTEVTVGVVSVAPEEEIEVEYEIEKFPEGEFLLEPSVRVTIVTALAEEYAATINGDAKMPQAYLISPLIAVSPADISLQPYQELELIISINIPYLVGGTGVMNIVTYTSSGSSLKFEKFVSVGKELEVLTNSLTPTQSFSLERPSSAPSSDSGNFSDDSLLTILYTLQVTTDSPPHFISYEVLLGDSFTDLRRDVTVVTPDMKVATDGGSGGGYIPGDTATLAVTVEYSDDSSTEAEDIEVLVTTPAICQNSKLLNSTLQVTVVNSTTLEVSLPSVSLTEETRILIECQIPGTVDTEGKSFQYVGVLSYRTPDSNLSDGYWKYEKMFYANLQIGEPQISVIFDTSPSPKTVQLITVQVLLRKGSSDLLINVELSEALILQEIGIADIGEHLKFQSVTEETIPFDNSQIIGVKGNTFSLSLGEVICSDETSDRGANSFSIQMSVFIDTETDPNQWIKSTVQYGRGEDSTVKAIPVLIPILSVELACSVDNTTCADVLQLQSQSRVTFTVSVTHTINSTGTAHNIILQLYVSLYDLTIISSEATDGIIEESGLGVKLTKKELPNTESLAWVIVMSVSNYETFADCSTAIVSLYDISAEENASVQMLPIIINFFSPKIEESFPYPDMYGKGVLGSTKHEYLYICNTSCYALSEAGDLIELNSAIHSLIGLTVTRTQYVLYGISRSGAHVISTSLDTWISIPHQIWTDLEDKIEPKTGPWPETVETSSGATYQATDTGVSRNDDLVFSW